MYRVLVFIPIFAKNVMKKEKIDLENILQERENLDILHVHVFLDKKIEELQSSLCEYSYSIDW